MEKSKYKPDPTWLYPCTECGMAIVHNHDSAGRHLVTSEWLCSFCYDNHLITGE